MIKEKGFIFSSIFIYLFIHLFIFFTFFSIYKKWLQNIIKKLKKCCKEKPVKTIKIFQINIKRQYAPNNKESFLKKMNLVKKKERKTSICTQPI